MLNDADIRLYNSDGTRKRLPSDWITGAEFEIGERGGMLTGSVSVSAKWEDLALTGTERVDIRLWGGGILYRGYVRQPQKEIAVPEKVTLSLYGVSEILAAYLVRQCLCYAAPVDIGQVFTDLVNRYAKRTNRQPNLIIDTTGVSALGITAESFCAKGSHLQQAMNNLCDMAPGELIWGCDVETASGLDRIYLRPRASAVGKKLSIGRDVSALTYPADTTQIVNRLYVTGGTLDGINTLPPNLITNASFEECEIPGETTSNLLINASFETNDGHNAFGWVRANDPTLDFVNAHSGSVSFNCDDNPTTPEALYQDVPIAGATGLSVSFWYGTSATGNLFELRIGLYDGSGTQLYLATSGGGPGFTEHAATATWLRYRLDYPSYPNDPAIVTARVAYVLQSCPSGSGVSVDDFALWLHNPIAKGWQVGTAYHATLAQIDWRNTDVAAYDGDVCVKAVTGIFSNTDGYVEIQSTPDGRVSVKSGTAYALRAQVYCATSPGYVVLGARCYDSGGSLLGTHTTSDQLILASGWYPVELTFRSDGGTVKVEPFLRLRSASQTYYVDAFGLYEGYSFPYTGSPSYYYPGDTFSMRRSTSDYSSGDIGSDAAGSIATYGERESAVTQDTIVTAAQLDAYCKAYFKAHAVPVVQGRLTLQQAAEPLRLDGQVQIVGLPSPPPALNIAKVKYSAGETIRIEADLNNERPDLATLLRKVTLGLTTN